MSNKYQCPCCGYFTLSEIPPGTFEICPVCFWEDDNVQYNDPNYSFGANRESLNQARKNYAVFKASSKDFIKMVREPFDDEKFDW